jgi:L-threonylcarbamoyladenylate synthase
LEETMNARVIKVDLKSADPAIIHELVRALHADGVIVYPTETFYGLGGNCLSRKVMKRIFKIKNRPVSKGLPVLVSDLEMVRSLVSKKPPIFHDLAARFWPGPLTFVLSAASYLPAELVGPRKTIGIRFPDVPWLQALIRELGVPLITTSANISGEGEIASPEEVIRLFHEKVDLVVDGGPTPGGLPSTVVDLTGEKPVLLREGVVGRKELAGFF